MGYRITQQQLAFDRYAGEFHQSKTNQPEKPKPQRAAT